MSNADRHMHAQVELFLLAPRNAGLARGDTTATLIKRRNDLLEVGSFSAFVTFGALQGACLAMHGRRGPLLHG